MTNKIKREYDEGSRSSKIDGIKYYNIFLAAE